MYKFRAETLTDVNSLLDIILPTKKLTKLNIKPLPPIMVDVEVVMGIESTSVDELRELMKGVEDGHVMERTLTPIDEK